MADNYLLVDARSEKSEDGISLDSMGIDEIINMSMMTLNKNQ